MGREAGRFFTRVLIIVLTFAAAICNAEKAGDEPALTFFGWSDQHVQTNGEGSHLVPAIEAMNALAGTPYPDKIGGKVGRPAFVFGCGDITEWPTRAARDTYDSLITKRLKWPAYDIVGNHDEGGMVPSETIKNYLLSRHKSLCYTFDRRGVHFLALHSRYDESLNAPAQPVAKEALDFLRQDLARQPRDIPIVVAAHHCFDSMTNRVELIDAFAGANVILVLGGHYHQAKVDSARGINFVQLPSPEPKGPREFMVVRITSDRLVAVPYNYQNRKWSDEGRKVLDAAIKGPSKDALSRTDSPKVK